jgi:predicted Zn-ribbon and HTH transcriptional regulator
VSNSDSTQDEEHLIDGGRFPPSIVYLIGPPAVGRFTVAKAIANLNDAAVVDNQLINIPIFSLLTESPDAEVTKGMWREIDSVRDAVFRMIEEVAPRSVSYVLTNALEDEPESYVLYDRVKRIAASRGSHFLPVVMTCEIEEELRRVQDPSRTERMKIDNIERARRYIENTPFFIPRDDEVLTIDTASLEPDHAAQLILTELMAMASALDVPIL